MNLSSCYNYDYHNLPFWWCSNDQSFEVTIWKCEYCFRLLHLRPHVYWPVLVLCMNFAVVCCIPTVNQPMENFSMELITWLIIFPDWLHLLAHSIATFSLVTCIIYWVHCTRKFQFTLLGNYPGNYEVLWNLVFGIQVLHIFYSPQGSTIEPTTTSKSLVFDERDWIRCIADVV